MVSLMDCQYFADINSRSPSSPMENSVQWEPSSTQALLVTRSCLAKYHFYPSWVPTHYSAKFVSQISLFSLGPRSLHSPETKRSLLTLGSTPEIAGESPSNAHTLRGGPLNGHEGLYWVHIQRNINSGEAGPSQRPSLRLRRAAAGLGPQRSLLKLNWHSFYFLLK